MKTGSGIVNSGFRAFQPWVAALILAVGGMAFADGIPKLDAGNFTRPEAIKHFGPFDWTSEPEKAIHPCERTKLEDRASFRKMNPDGMPLIGYAGRMSSFPWSADGKREGLVDDGVWYLLRNGKMMARFVWRPQPRNEVPGLSYEAALFLYPANPNLTHGWSPAAVLERPFAVLTIENDPATPAPFFCAFTPESHLNFGLCERPKNKKEAARFFFEFLCEHPQREVYCLGCDRFADNVQTRGRFERATFKLKETTEEIPPERVLEELKPQIDKAKAESRAMAEKYDMVLWPDGDAVSAGSDIGEGNIAIDGDMSGAKADNAAAFVNGVRVEGAAPGEWTHDWDAATAAAKERGMPIFVNFTGSDWCGWCKLLKRQVFARPEWTAWAGNHVYLIHIDFPNDKELVPEKYRDRNRELARKYKVGGYPTCYLLDPATLEPLGRFGASRDVTASKFIEEVTAAMPTTKPGSKGNSTGKGLNGKDLAPGATTTKPGAESDTPESPKSAGNGDVVFDIENGVLRGVKSGEAEEIVVPEGVRTVCIDGLVHGRMKVLTIPEGVETISRRSGGYYPGARIETVRLPASVRTISDTAFDGHWKRLRTIEIAAGSPYAMKNGCLIDTRSSSLVFALPGQGRIAVPDSVKEIGPWAFNANDATEIEIPEGVAKICRGAFDDCLSLTKISLPASVDIIEPKAFAKCGKLTEIIIAPGNSRLLILDGLLVDRTAGKLIRAFGPLTHVVIPAEVKTIGEDAFSSMDSLVSVTVPDSVTRIEDSAFSYCKKLEELRLPQRLDFCGEHFIMGCAALKGIQLPVGLENLSGMASFSGCSSLREIAFPEGLHTIGSLGLGAVYRCDTLERIWIPASVTKIGGNGPFRENPRLAAIDVHPDNPSFRSEDGVLFSKDMTRLVRCPEKKTGVYEIPRTVKRIDGYAFANCHSLIEIRIPTGATDIGYGAFEDCPAKRKEK